MATQIEQLQALRIFPSEDIPPHQFLYQWQNKPCFARGELVALTGKAKSGKTYVCSLLIALSEQAQILGLMRPQEAPYRVLWIDTEQSEDSTQEILCQRVGALIGHQPDAERIVVYNLRQLNWQDRLPLIEAAICNHSPDLVIFDGIRDVVGDINDYQQAQDVLTKMLSIASWSNACIVCVLHQNKSAEDKTLRGALGTELQNKSFETYECQKDTMTHQFSLQQTATRKYDIYGKLQFVVNDAGLPTPPLPTTPLPTTPLPTTPLPQKPTFNPEYVGTDGKLNQPKLFQYILPDGKRMTLPQLRQVVMNVAHVENFNFAGTIIQEALQKRIIFTTQVDNTNYYQISPTLF